MAVLLAACAAPGPARLPLPELPAEWRHGPTADAASTARWWVALHDAQLSALIEEALVRNADVARSALRLEQAALEARRAGWDRWPRIDADLSAGAQRPLGQQGARSILIDGVSVPVNSGPSTTVSAGASISASYEPDLWGRLSRSARAADLSVTIGETDLETARWLLTAKTAEHYWTLAALDTKRELAQANRDDAADVLRAVLLRHAEGKALVSDVDRAIASLDERRKLEQLLLAQRAVAVLELAQLLDRVPQSFALPAALLPEPDPPDWSAGPPASVLDRRPDVRKARLSLDAALLKHEIAQDNWYPRIQLSVTVTTGGNALDQALSNPIGSVAAAIALPLIDWRRLKLEREQATLQARDAELAFRQALLQALADVDRLFVQRRERQSELASARARLDSARQLLETTRLRYEVGTAAQMALREASITWRDACMAVIDARMRAWLNHVALQKAIGGPVASSG